MRRRAAPAVSTAKVAVVVVTYNDSGNSRDFAFETVDHLRGKYGIDVHEPLLWGDGKILVLAGAAPTRADLARLVEKIETATGPDGKPNAFKDPYIVEIDDYVGR